MQKSSSLFLRKIEKFIEQKELMNNSQLYLVALSGGADSVALLLALKKLDELENLYNELEDRFGKIKSEAKGFFDFIKIRIIARDLGITTIKQDKENKDRILINFNEKKINVDKIIYLLSNKKIMYSKFTRTIGYNGNIFEFFKLYSS